tara:strand:+ start:1873 stop:2622 length:750 start_codon:yes stop_codon:yes gene_type:complete
MLKKRIIISLTFQDGVLFRTKKFIPDYRYTKNFVDLWNADEIVLIDVSNKENKLNNNFIEVVNFFINNCHLPISVGGGINSISNAKKVFDLGVERIILNSVSYYDKNITDEICETYGSSSVIHSLDCKKIKDEYFVYINNGKDRVKKNILECCRFIKNLNVGELLINSIDNDGGLMGFDIELIKLISKNVDLPIIVQGGAGNWDHFFKVLNLEYVNGACTQNIYHFTEPSLLALKEYLFKRGVAIRYEN